MRDRRPASPGCLLELRFAAALGLVGFDLGLYALSGVNLFLLFAPLGCGFFEALFLLKLLAYVLRLLGSFSADLLFK